jgi:hypothetical protein
METVSFHFVADEFDDGEIYFPRKEVLITHDQVAKGTLNEITDSFKEFLTALGYLPETVALLQVVEKEAEF